MNTLKKRLIALSLFTCVAMSSVVGCGSNSSSSSEKNYSADSSSSDESVTEEKAAIDIEAITNASGNPIKLPVQSGEAGNGGVTAENGMNLSGLDPEDVNTSPEPDIETVTVVNENGEPVTESVPVTNANGEAVTEAGGQPVTEFVPVTSVIAKEITNPDYKSNSEGRYVLWMDISKDENFVFNDQFIKVQFKIKEDTPDGNYPISIVTDLSSIKGVSIDPDKIVNGTIKVGGTAPAAKDHSNEGFVVYGDTIGAKAGDTVDFYINCKNNPGLAAVLLWFYYDSNAMECKSVKSAGEFAEIDGHPETGKSEN
ncbi:MAG: hypothetical protein GXY08_09030 [Ruminococcus sp.]|nr:hypothetical protein [Ruminococcus sp.]